MNEALSYVLMALAAHRLWLVWMNQVVGNKPLAPADNPYEFIRKGLRRLASPNTALTLRQRLGNTVLYGLTCGICVSVQISVLVGGLWLTGWPGRGVIWVLAVSSGVSFFDDLMTSFSRPRPLVLYQQPAYHMHNTPPQESAQQNGR